MATMSSMIGGWYEASTMSQAETAVRAMAARLEAQAVRAAISIDGVNSGRLEERIAHRLRSAVGHGSEAGGHEIRSGLLAEF